MHNMCSCKNIRIILYCAAKSILSDAHGTKGCFFIEREMRTHKGKCIEFASVKKCLRRRVGKRIKKKTNVCILSDHDNQIFHAHVFHAFNKGITAHILNCTNQMQIPCMRFY